MDEGFSPDEIDEIVRAARDVTLVPPLSRLADAIEAGTGDDRIGGWLRAVQSDRRVCLRCATRGSTVFVRWDRSNGLVEVERRGETYTSPERTLDATRAEALVVSSPAVGLVSVGETPFDAG